MCERKNEETHEGDVGAGRAVALDELDGARYVHLIHWVPESQPERAGEEGAGCRKGSGYQCEVCPE